MPESPRGLRSVATRLVVKSGVSLGGLPHVERGVALGLVWGALAGQAPMDEKAVNAALRAELEADDGAASHLATDHVELRRWMVDSGWLHRDGFGRRYDVVEPAALREDLQPVADAIAGLAAAGGGDAGEAGRTRQEVRLRAWIAQVRAGHTLERERRRVAWQAGTPR